MLRHLARVISLAPQLARLAAIEGVATVAPRIEGSSAKLLYSKSWGTCASATRPSADASTTISAAASSSSAPAVSQYAQCWNCGESRGRRGVGFCGGCGKIQALQEDISPFAVLGMEETYDIDYFKLEDNYKRLQWSIHPDKFATASGQERELSTHNSTLINNAYRTLRCPLSRARYLLQRAGVDFGEGGEGTLEDPELLMEIMETRESVEDAASPGALMQLRRDNEGHRADVIGKLKEAFAARDLATAQQLLIRLIYYARIGDEIKQRL